MFYKVILKTTDGRKHTLVKVSNIDCDGKILSITYLVRGVEWTRNYNWNSLEYYSIAEETENEG